MPEVSVIVTTNNRKEYLSMAIEAILNQTYKDFELIVVDNFSDYDFFALIDRIITMELLQLTATTD